MNGRIVAAVTVATLLVSTAPASADPITLPYRTAVPCSLARPYRIRHRRTPIQRAIAHLDGSRDGRNEFGRVDRGTDEQYYRPDALVRRWGSSRVRDDGAKRGSFTASSDFSVLFDVTAPLTYRFQ